MQHRQRTSDLLELGANLQQASGVARRDGFGTGREDVACFACAERMRRLGLDQVLDTRRPAAEGPFRNFEQLQVRDGAQHAPRLAGDSLAVLQVTRVVVRDAQMNRMTRRSRLEVGEHFRNITAS